MSDRAPTPGELRQTALTEIARGDIPDGTVYATAVAPAYFAALVDRVEALAERIGNRSLIYMDNGHILEAEMIGMIEEEIRALLREPLEPGGPNDE